MPSLGVFETVHTSTSKLVQVSARARRTTTPPHSLGHGDGPAASDLVDISEIMQGACLLGLLEHVTTRLAPADTDEYYLEYGNRK